MALSPEVVILVTGGASVFSFLDSPDVLSALGFQFGVQAVATDDAVTVRAT